ncbi:MAG: hydrogenase nickel incorporation protein HypA [Bacillales bacterium]|nr:hydrogenase nickel incorporation protein HypA [Bacillales bacterium]
MHEMALMGDILQIVWEDAQNQGFSKINRIELTVGTLSQAMPDALEMAFSIYKEQYQNIFDRSAEVIFDVEEAVACCTECNTTYIPDRKITICPECGMPTGNLIKGQTFQVKSYEGS